MRRLLLALLLVAAVATAALGWAAARWLATPLAVPAGGVTVVLEPGEPFAALAARLERAGVLDQADWLRAYARWRGDAARVQAGEYQLQPGTTPRQLLDLLVSGRVLLHELTLVEGWTFATARAAIAAHPAVRVELAGLDDRAVMDRLGRPGQHPEGRLLPDTYRFARGTTDRELLGLAAAALDRALAEAWAARAPDLPLATAEEALVLASLVEKETGAPDERPLVAGVFVNRLRLGMRLQTDPSVIYGLGAAFDGNLRKADLLRDGPYNTYRRAGLPPTPIALVGAAALAAATRPAATEALYFVATGRGDGRHYFARTLAEHNRNVARYLDALRAGRQAGE